MRKLILLIILFPNYVFAEPMLDMSGIQCRAVYFQHLNPRTPEKVESLYCGYQVGLKNFDMLTSRIGYGSFSTKENIEGYRALKLPELKKTCEESKSKALEILEKEFPDYKIDCGRYLNFNKIMNSQ